MASRMMIRNAPSLLAILLLSSSLSVRAQESVTPAPALEFLGFRAGASLGDVSTALTRVRGGALKCQGAKVDKRVSECRADFTDPAAGRPLELWLSAVDSMSSVLMLSGTVSGDQLILWRRTLERAYGQVDANVHGPQWMMQWVRQGRMIRLTWRLESGRKLASVSLIDGHVLDAWGEHRGARRPTRR
ncbi:MAG: hypothetical protein ABJD11_00135 [Gemmatimonadota bacterium]